MTAHPPTTETISISLVLGLGKYVTSFFLTAVQNSNRSLGRFRFNLKRGYWKSTFG